MTPLAKIRSRGRRLIDLVTSFRRGYQTAANWPQPSGEPQPPKTNPFLAYFESVKAGPGVWKWRHYFDAYDRHFSRFIGRPEVNVLEIGIYSGGSLPMWRHVFGPGCRVIGADIMPECRAYERDGIRVVIGDQADRSFWRGLRGTLPPLDIVIDDGGHTPEQQIVTLEEALPLLRPGGVYLCEDVHGTLNPFHAYVAGLCSLLHSAPSDGGSTVAANGLQNLVQSVTIYPYCAVIETREYPLGTLHAPRHGTEWRPLL